jgi:hypothetical protein
MKRGMGSSDRDKKTIELKRVAIITFILISVISDE